MTEAFELIPDRLIEKQLDVEETQFIKPQDVKSIGEIAIISTTQEIQDTTEVDAEMEEMSKVDGLILFVLGETEDLEDGVSSFEVKTALKRFSDNDLQNSTLDPKVLDRYYRLNMYYKTLRHIEVRDKSTRDFPDNYKTEIKTNNDESVFFSFEANCRGMDPGIFFPHKKETDRKRLVSEAKKICADCSGRLACLEYALENNEVYGIWGGKDFKERKAILRGIGIINN